MRILLASQTDTIELAPGEHVIGRDLECQLRFNDAAVSRRHVSIRVEAMGVTIEDLGSRNGTYVNERLVVARQEIRDGDMLRVGRRLFTVHVLPDGERVKSEEDTWTEPGGGVAIRRIAAELLEADRGKGRRSPTPPPPTPPSVTCPGCRGAVPVQAEQCPQCGRPRHRKTLGVTMQLTQDALKELADAADALSAENRKEDDRRRSRRYPVELPVIYISPTLMFEAVGTDLSVHGIFVATELLDEPGTPCSVTLLPDGASALHLKGRVARVDDPARRPGSPGIGVEFEPLEASLQGALTRLIGRTRLLG